jgi:hypothetical protein
MPATRVFLCHLTPFFVPCYSSSHCSGSPLPVSLHPCCNIPAPPSHTSQGHESSTRSGSHLSPSTQAATTSRPPHMQARGASTTHPFHPLTLPPLHCLCPVCKPGAHVPLPSAPSTRPTMCYSTSHSPPLELCPSCSPAYKPRASAPHPLLPPPPTM